MKHLIELEPAYLLHSRPFRDTSLLLDFLTPGYGRISAIARGGRSPKSKSRGLLQPFTPIHISLSGKSELKTLRTVELRAPGLPLRGQRLFSAMYVNEIITRLFQSHDADPDFFHDYEHTLSDISCSDSQESVLRTFELRLLDTLGYGVDFSTEADTHGAIDPAAWYYYQDQSGFIRYHLPPDTTGDRFRAGIFAGVELLGIARRDFSHDETRRAAKVILRTMLGNHLGDRPLASRTLFAARR